MITNTDKSNRIVEITADKIESLTAQFDAVAAKSKEISIAIDEAKTSTKRSYLRKKLIKNNSKALALVEEISQTKMLAEQLLSTYRGESE